AEFSQAIADVNRKLRAIKSEFNAASDGTKAWANSLEGLQAKSENLTRQIEVHRQKVESLKRQYEDVAAAQGADSRAAENLLAQYNNAVGVMRRMETSLETVNRRVQEQTSEFGLLQRRVNASVESMDRELRVLESSFEQVANSMGQAHGAANELGMSEGQLRTRQDQLNQSIDIQRRRLAELNTLLEATTREEGQNSRAAQEMQIRYNQASQALNRTQSELHQTNTALQTQSSAWSRLGQALGGSMSRLSMVGMNLQMTGMNIAMTFGVAAAAVSGAMGSAVKKSIDFGAEMSKTGAIANATGKDLEALRQSALKLGSTTSLTATQVAEAQTEMAKKGFATNQIIAAMPGIISAAEASGEDLAMVADTVTSAISSFGLAASKSSHVADVLARAANDSAAGVEDMQYAFKYAAAPAHALGMSIEELAASTE
ncbi:MAG TPA: phage tail tape measure protein, partial [Saprospiraceae bacterium]|nr:phage tail tape measure protein [Saprospiraceae bacterium]